MNDHDIAMHYTANGFEEDKLGFFVPKCSCGWECPPAPDEETATDFLMQHAYEAGLLAGRLEKP